MRNGRPHRVQQGRPIDLRRLLRPRSRTPRTLRPLRQATTRGPPRRTRSPRCVRCYPRPKRPCLTCGQVARRPRSLRRASLPTLLRSHCQAQAGMRTLRTVPVDQPARHRPHARPGYSCDPGPQDTCPDAAGSPRERDTRTAYRSAHAATSARSSLRLLRRARTHHGTVAERRGMFRVLPARARQAENLPRLRTITNARRDRRLRPAGLRRCAGSGPATAACGRRPIGRLRARPMRPMRVA